MKCILKVTLSKFPGCQLLPVECKQTRAGHGKPQQDPHLQRSHVVLWGVYILKANSLLTTCQTSLTTQPPPPIRAERKDKSGSPHMEWGANSNSSSLSPEQRPWLTSGWLPGIQEQCTRVPKLLHSLWFPVTRKPFHPTSVKYSLHTFHVLWDLEGDDTLGSIPSCCMPWLYSSRIWSYRNIKYLFQMPCIQT